MRLLPWLLGSLMLAAAAAPAVEAADAPQLELWDAPRTVSVFTWGVLMPVDSVDVVHAAWWSTGARLDVVDTTRTGPEDALTAPEGHALRAWFLLAVYADTPGHFLLSAAAEVPRSSNGGGFSGITMQVTPDGVANVSSGASLDGRGVTWTFPPQAPPVALAVVTALVGCKPGASCGSSDVPGAALAAAGAPLSLGGAYVGDLAPKDLRSSGWLGSAQPPVWWQDLFPSVASPASGGPGVLAPPLSCGSAPSCLL